MLLPRGSPHFLWPCGMPEAIDWNDPHFILVYIDGVAFVGPGSDMIFNERSVSWARFASFPGFRHGGLTIDVPRGTWSL